MIFELFGFVAAAPQGQSPGGSDLFGMLVPFLCIGVIFYFLIIRPQKKKQQEHATLVGGLKSGDKVITAGGLHGLIANVKESTVVLKVADNVKIEVEKGSIDRVAKQTQS